MEIHNIGETIVAAALATPDLIRGSGQRGNFCEWCAVDRALLLRQHAEQKMSCRSKRALVISEASVRA